MKTEQKAKAYDEALEQAQKELAACGSINCDAARQIFRLFPQLRESEDERIRNEIIAFIEQAIHSGGGISVPKEKEDRWLAYLEKQKEQKPAEKQDLVARLKEHLANTPKEQLEAEWKELEKWNHVGPTVEEYLRGIKPAEWSEEDDKMLQRIIRHTESEYQDWCNDKFGNSEIVSDGKRSCLERLDWLENRLKSLRPQPQQNMSIGFMLYLDEHRPDGKMYLSNAECNEIETAFKNQSWDTILRYAEKYIPHWKPSEEQMEALRVYLYHPQYIDNSEDIKIKLVESLYNDLLKLM